MKWVAIFLFSAGVVFSADPAVNDAKKVANALEQNLLEQLKFMKEQAKNGLMQYGAVVKAEIALCEFRRDNASEIKDKIKNQEIIVKAWQMQLMSIRKQWETGAAERMDLMKAEEALLRAELVLAKLKEEKKS